MSGGLLLPGPALVTPGVRKATVAPGGSWTPADLPGLHRWFDPSQLTGKSDGDAVSSHTDLSGNAGHAVQATGSKQPLYKVNQFGSLPGLVGDGVDDLLVAPTDIDATLTLFTVGKMVSGTCLLSLGGANEQVYNAGGVWKYYSDAASGFIDIGGVATNPTVVTLKFTSASSLTTYRDGTLVETADPFDGYFGFPNELVFFAESNAGGGVSNSVQGETLIYDTPLGDTDRATVEDYLAAKWGTP